MPETAYIAVGSNINPECNILAAIERLARQTTLTAVSTFYRTKPLKHLDHPVFLNGMCMVRTEHGPRALKFEVLRPIEEALGRVRTRDAYAPRTIDLDLILYGDLRLAEADLRVPDPDIRDRPFVSVPLLELAPDAALPDTGEKLACVVRKSDTTGLARADAFTAMLRERLAL